MAKPHVFSPTTRARKLARLRRATELAAKGRCFDARGALDDARILRGTGKRISRAATKAARAVASCRVR